MVIAIQKLSCKDCKELLLNMIRPIVKHLFSGSEMNYPNIFVYFIMAQKVVVVPQTIFEVFEICVPLIRLPTSRS
jgi:hypothetical protein